MRKWGVAAAFLVFLVWEIWAVRDGDPHTWPLTQIVVTYVPAPVTAAVIVWFVAWLPLHFANEYRKKGKTMTTLTPPDPTEDHPAEPVLTRGTAVALLSAVLGLLIAFGVDLSDKQQSTIMDVGVIVLPALASIAVAVWSRRHVYSKASVVKLLEAERLRTKT